MRLNLTHKNSFGLFLFHYVLRGFYYTDICGVHITKSGHNGCTEIVLSHTKYGTQAK